MRNSFFFVIVALLVAFSLVFSSCGTKTTEAPTTTVVGTTSLTTTAKPTTTTAPATGKDMVTLTLTKSDGTTMQKTVERPKYGGIVRTVQTAPTYIDGIFGLDYSRPTKNTNECIWEGKWELGPSGTGEFTFQHNVMPPLAPFMADEKGGGGATERFEVVNDTTVVFHIRKGMSFHNKPPTNGREMDANDVVFSLTRIWKAPQSYAYSAAPWDTYLEYIKATDKWTVEIKAKPGRLSSVLSYAVAAVFIVPREVIDKYGDMNDWHNICGTGAFMLTDYVANSSATYVRNPNYWMHDPLFPKNKLPYLEGIRELYITDQSTIVAGLRTGKIDHASPSKWEDVDNLMKTVPSLVKKEYMGGHAIAIGMRQDNPSLPWYDVRVRQAMMLAINHQEIKDSYYGGHAEIHEWPVLNNPDVDWFGDMYVPLEKLPESTRRLFEYHPDEAKALLAQAGYSNGFTADVVCVQTDVDRLSIAAAYLAKVGITLNLQVKEPGTYNTIVYGGQLAHMAAFTCDCTAEFSQWVRLGAGNSLNIGKINDPIIEKARLQTGQAGLNARALTMPMKNAYLYIVEQCKWITMCNPNVFILWQKWLKGYNGETFPGLLNTYKNWPKFVWIDEQLKEELQ